MQVILANRKESSRLKASEANRCCSLDFIFRLSTIYVRYSMPAISIIKT